MSSKVGNPQKSKSFYENKADEFIHTKKTLGENPSPLPQVQNIAVKKWAVIEFLSSLFKTKKEVISEHSELSKDLKVCEEISPKMFGLILDDHAIGTTNFEGVRNCSDTIDYMGTILAKNKHRFESLGIDTDRFIKQFAFPSAIIHDLETLFEGKRNLTGKEQEAVLKELQKIGENVAAAVKNLSAGERLLLPGGWTGHAILYEVIKDKNGTYRFAIYNTGDGLQHHVSIFHDLKQKHQGYVEIEGISAEKMCSPSFYKTLFEIRNLNTIKTEEDKKIKGATELYLGLLKSLGGKRKNVDKGRLSYRSDQRSGTCAWKCMMEALRQSCTTYQQYRRLKYLVQCQTLTDFAKTLEKMDIPKLPVKERQSLKHLLKVSSAKIGRSFTKSFDKGWISKKELEEGIHLTEKLKTSITTTPSLTGILEDKNSIKITPLKNKNAVSFEDTPQAGKSKDGAISGGMPDLPELDFKDNTKLDKQIDLYYEVFQKGGNAGATALRGLEILSTDIMKLPMPKKGMQDIWDTLSQEEITKKTEQLSRLIKICSWMVSIADKGCSPKILLGTLHLLAILDKLTKKSVNSKLPNAPVYAGLIKDFTQVGFILPTKELQEYRQAIEAYFEASKKTAGACLFSFAGFKYEEIIPYQMLYDFAKGPKPPSQVSKEYYLDKEYINKCLSDPIILEKLHTKGIYVKRAQIQALLEDFTEYLPTVDGQLKESVLLATLMQLKLRPTFGNIYADVEETSYSTYSFSYGGSHGPNPDKQLEQLLPEAIEISPGYIQVGRDRFSLSDYTNNGIKYLKLSSAPEGKMTTQGGSIIEDKKHIISLWEDSKKLHHAPHLARELSHFKLTPDNYDSKERFLSEKIKFVKKSIFSREKVAVPELTNDMVLKNYQNLTNLSAEEMLHISLTNIDEKDAPWRLLSFLEERFSAFQEKGIQTLLLSYLYHPSVTKILQEQPLFIEKLVKQALRAYELYKQDGDLETAAFMMHYLKRAEGRYEEIFKNTNPFNHIVYKDNLLALRPLVKNNDHRRSLDIAMGLLHYQGSYLNKPFTEDLGYDVLKATFALQNRPSNPEDDRYYQLYRQELRHLQIMYRREIANYLNSQTPANRDRILNELLGEGSANKHWEGSYPDYIYKSPTPNNQRIYNSARNIMTNEHESHYNVVRGELSLDGRLNKKPRPVPENDLEEYGLPKETIMSEDGFYYSSDKQKRVSLNDSNAVVCEYYINNEWRQWTSNALKDRRALYALGLSNATGHYTITNGHVVLANDKKNPLYEAEYDTNNFVDKVTKTIGNKKYSLIDLKEAMKDSGVQLLSFLQYYPETDDPKVLPNINVTLWQGAANDPPHLEIMNGVFTFEKRDGNYYSLEHEGYCLSAPKEEPLCGFMEYIHLIHKTSGKEKIIILSPNEEHPERGAQATFFSPLNFSRKSQVFNLDKDGMPIIKTSKDCMWLAHTALTIRNYKEASLYLSRAEEMGKADDASRSLLLKIQSMTDNHPDAINCKMQAMCLLKKNAILHGEDKEKDAKEGIADSLFKPDLYVDYLTTYGKGLLSPLPISMEKSLWRNISDAFFNETIRIDFPLLERRREELQSGKKSQLVEPIDFEEKELPFSEGIKDKAFSDTDEFFPPNTYHILDPKVRLEKEKDLILNRNLLPFLGAGKSFRAHFIDFYKDAKNKSKDLLPRLLAMRGETDEANRYLAAILEKVMEKGSSFPKAPELTGGKYQIDNAIANWTSSVKRSYQDSQYTFMQKISMLFQKIVVLVKIAFQYINAWVDSKITLWAKFRAKVFSWIKAWKTLKLHTLIKELKLETSGKSSTRIYHTKNLNPKKILSLPLTKEVLFNDPITKVDQALVEELKKKAVSAQNKMQALEKTVLELIEKLPQDSSVANLIRMKRLGGDESVLTMEDLMGIFVVGQSGPYLENTYLTQAGVGELEFAVGQYLQQKILKDHAEACLELHTEYTQAKAEDKPYVETKLSALANEKPQYEPKDHREYLVFEAMTGVRLRPEQREKLALLSGTDRTSVILHMIMGAGKSTVITPVAALLMARQGFLPVIVVPDSLHQTGKETTKLTVFKSFGRQAHPFEMSRESDFSKEKLQTLLESLKQWKEEKGFIYTTRESLLSFLLKSKELFYQYEETQGVEAKQELKETIELSWAILREFKQGAAALLDEAHSLLNCRDELNFTFGHSKRVERSEAETVYEILGFLVNDPQMKALIDLKNNNQAKMSDETYTNTVKPILVDRLVKKFGVPKEYFYNATDTVPDVVKNHLERDLIAMGKAVVSTFLPHTLSKKRDEHYGLGSTSKYCIPYVGNNTPNEKAEFASYVETLLYTGYYYVQQELTVEQLKTFRVESLEKCRQEQVVSKILVSETKANALFKKITGQDLSGPFDEAAAQQYIKDHPEMIFQYCVEKIVPEISIFPSKLSANPHHLAAFFKQVDGMTGTPWNKDAYPSQFKTAEEQQIDDKSSQIILKTSNADLITLTAQKDEEMLQNIIDSFRAQPQCRAVIDAGALIKNVSNEDVAKALLAASDPNTIDGVAYYNDENELLILERATGESVIFKDSVIPKERRLTFYDQRHTLGSDITQQRDAKALVTLSETIKKFELFQAIWRLREIDKGQTLTFLIPQSITHLIASDKLITPQKLLDFVTHNQKEQELFDNFRSRKMEIKAIVEEAMHDAFMEATSFEARLKIFSKTRDLLMQPLDLKPFEAFGGIDKEEDALKILQEHTKKWLGVLADLQKKKVIKDAAKYKKKIESLKPIPLNPKYPITENSTLDTQIENQVEMQVKLTVATKPDAYKEGIEPWTVWEWPQSLDIFKDNWMKTVSWFSSGPMPLYQAQTLLGYSKNPKVSRMKKLFNDSFLVSNNFLPQKVKQWKEIYAQPFAWYAKPVYHLVVTQESNGKIKTLMIDQNDLPFFRDKLLQDSGNASRKICIYDPAIGITLQGKKGFDEKALQKNPEFVKHIVYAKFWNGVSKYTPEEVVYLESWIKSHGVDKMYEFFQEIVRNKEDSAKAFANSVLANVFEKLYQVQK